MNKQVLIEVIFEDCHRLYEIQIEMKLDQRKARGDGPNETGNETKKK